MEEGSLVDVTGDNCNQLVGSRVQIVAKPTESKSQEVSAKTKGNTRKRVTLKAEAAESEEQPATTMEKPAVPEEQKPTTVQDPAKEPDSADGRGQESEIKIEDAVGEEQTIANPTPNSTDKIKQAEMTNADTETKNSKDQSSLMEKNELSGENAKREESEKPDQTELPTDIGQTKLEQGGTPKNLEDGSTPKNMEEASKIAAETANDSKVNDKEAEKSLPEKEEEPTNKKEQLDQKECVPLENAANENPIEDVKAGVTENSEASGIKAPGASAEVPPNLTAAEDNKQPQDVVAPSDQGLQPIAENPVNNQVASDQSARKSDPSQSLAPAMKAKKLVKKKDSKVRPPPVEEKTMPEEPDSAVASENDALTKTVESTNDVVPPAEDIKEESRESLDLATEVVQEMQQSLSEDAFIGNETDVKRDLDLVQILASVSDKLDDLEEETRLGQAKVAAKAPFSPSLDEKRSIEELLAAARPSRTIEQLIASSIVTYEETMNAHRRRNVEQVYVCTLAALKLK